MQPDSGATPTLWTATAPEMPPFPPLHEDTSADVCVVGAGIAGLTTALMLLRQGRSVIVLDDGPVAGGETARTTAHLSSALDDRYTELERLFGEDGARHAAESHTAAIDLIERLVGELTIDCDFERLDGYLFVPPDGETDELERELEAAHRAGLAGVEMVGRAPIERFNTGAALRFPDQGQFHPLRYIAGLVREIVRLGGRICCRTHACDFRDGTPTRVRTSAGHTVTSACIVVATNTPVNDRVTMHTKQHAYRAYVIGARVPRGSVTRALYWDTADPYHYVRLQPVDQFRLPADAEDEHRVLGHDILIVGGEDHKTGQADDFEERFKRLIEWTRYRFPMIESIDFRWSGQVMEPVDSLAFIGLNPGRENIYIATGDSGHGMTHGTIAGMLLTDLIVGRENPWADLYDPSRRSLRSVGEWVRENINAVSHYANWLAGGEVASEDEIPRGEGAVMRQGLSKVACYKDETGEVHRCSAVCPHLGGQVQWNRVERSWDCPVHGSRFDPLGKMLNGPAGTGLAPVTVERAEPAPAGAGVQAGQLAAGEQQPAPGPGRAAEPRRPEGADEAEVARRTRAQPRQEPARKTWLD